MIRKLKIKVIALAMAAVCALLAVVVTGMNLINYYAVVAEADSTLSMLSQNRGSFPEQPNNRPGPGPKPMSPELPYESRYFSVVVSSDGTVVLADTGKIAAVDADTAGRFAVKALVEKAERGFIGDYRYRRAEENGNIRFVFLDCGRKLHSFYTFCYGSIAMALVGIIAVFFVILFCAGRMIRPIAQSYEKQKQFITDAGHELKTPLTIIRANVDVLEMEQGDNEYLTDIRQQAERLTRLTNDLVQLSRMEEAENTLQMIDFPVSEVVEEAAQPFQTLAQTQEKQLLLDIQPMLTLKGNPKGITQLVSILLDNALKYSPAGETVELQLQRSGKLIYLTVKNTAITPLSGEALSHIFDRFYRADASRSSETGGHGIGLSVAKAIVTAHGGKLQASTPDGKRFVITAAF